MRIMAQSGFHGLIGLGVARIAGRRIPGFLTDPSKGGLCVGAMLPDIDTYPTAVAYLLGHKAVYDIHRTATHSAVALALVLLAVATVGAIVFADYPSRQNVLVSTPCLLFFAPFAWVQTRRLRGSIGKWCRSEGAEP